MSKYKKNLNSYNSILNLVKDNKDCYDIVESIKNKYEKQHKKDNLSRTGTIILGIVAFCIGASLFDLRNGLLIYLMCIWFTVFVVGLTVYSCLISVSWNTKQVINRKTLKYINDVLKENYVVYSNESKYKLLFKGGKCYIWYSDLGVVKEVNGEYKEGNCKLEVRKYYEVKGLGDVECHYEPTVVEY